MGLVNNIKEPEKKNTSTLGMLYKALYFDSILYYLYTFDKKLTFYNLSKNNY